MTIKAILADDTYTGNSWRMRRACVRPSAMQGARE